MHMLCCVCPPRQVKLHDSRRGLLLNQSLSHDAATHGSLSGRNRWYRYPGTLSTTLSPDRGVFLTTRRTNMNTFGNLWGWLVGRNFARLLLTYGTDKRRCEVVLGEPEQDTRFSHSGIAYEQQFKQVIVSFRHGEFCVHCLKTSRKETRVLLLLLLVNVNLMRILSISSEWSIVLRSCLLWYLGLPIS